MTQHTSVSSGIRRGPRRSDNFSIIYNDVINDVRLSFRARGVLIWLLSKPADWSARSQAIADQSPDGRESVRTAMRELQRVGYLVIEKVRCGKTGQIRTVQTVYEVPVDVEDSQVIPAPRKPVTRVAEAGEGGAFTSTEAPRTETNNNIPAELTPRQCSTTGSSLSERLSKIRSADDQKIADLEIATLNAGLFAGYDHIKATQRTAILELVDKHGIPALAQAAQRAHRVDNPTLHAQGWLRLWQALPVHRAVAGPPTPEQLRSTCGECVGGWVEDADGMPVRRCACRTQAVAV